jgi:hypothetical protein
MPRFADVLDRNMEDIKRPPPPPLGHYIMRVTKMPDPAEEMTGRDGTLYEKLTIPVAIVSAAEDVDPAELSAYGNVSGVPLRFQFIFNTTDQAKFEGTLNRLKEFMAKCGVDVVDGRLGEKMPELVNAQFVAQLEHRMDPNDESVVYPEIGRVTAL